MKNKVKYGLLGYNPWHSYVVDYNMGDYIQSLAARRFLPKVHFIIDRERLHDNYLNLDIKNENKLIMNGWFMHNASNWPPHNALSTLMISIHITESATNKMLSKEGIRYFKEREPIGCRDIHTLELLSRHGINAYFSGCLTLTLPEKRKNNKVEDYILSVDLDNDINYFYRRQSMYPIINLTQVLPLDYNETQRFALAEKYLDIFAKARCVITSRLHVALPCLAMKTPVLLINTQADQYRFSGLNTLVINASKEDCLSGKIDFDINNPPSNPSEYLKYRKELINTVNNFIKPNRFYKLWK